MTPINRVADRHDAAISSPGRSIVDNDLFWRRWQNRDLASPFEASDTAFVEGMLAAQRPFAGNPANP